MAASDLGVLGDDVACQRLERSPSPPPGNLEYASQGSQFCLHTYSHLDGGINIPDNDHLLQLHSRQVSHPASPSRSSRSSTLSTVSTNVTVPDCDCANTTASTTDKGTRRHSRTNSSLPAKRSRRDREQLHAARLQRSRRNGPPLGSKDTNIKHSKAGWNRRKSGNSGTADALAAFEPANEHNLSKMSTLEQQRWINVQQKTFTKWYVDGLKLNSRRGSIREEQAHESYWHLAYTEPPL